MGIYTLVFNIVTGSFIAPVVYGRVASIHPAVVLVAIPAGSTLAGVLGMFLAVPVIGIVAVTWRSALRLLDPAGVVATEPATQPAANPARAAPAAEPASAEAAAAKPPPALEPGG
jgi:predicted PurR-regulated permease PerM